ncbi:hypothetical protein Acr_06g0008180 [Actinidia rufa]|uniref:RNase H type-1 domain-containing protein n=1 Tax=Actinidia rufa TaxID=165716 RepID=A0A7J0EQV4_9ERIC|nr:hypothetical protein Acr_06g0008180 [Actinidia rufa]
MHLRSRYLPRPSASSSPDNRAPPMANTSQAPNLEGLHREIHGMAEEMRIMNENNACLVQLLTMANPQPPAAPPIPDIEGRRRSPSPPRRERSSSSESSEVPAVGGEEMRRGRSPRRGHRIGARDKSTSQKIRDLDAQLDAINTGTNAPIIVDTLIRQTKPPFIERVLRAWVSSRFKLPTQLRIYEGKTDPMDHLDSYKSLMSLQGCSDETVLEVEDPSDKVVIMAMMEGLRPGPPFDSLSKNIFETLSALQSKADKYIAAEELAEAKRKRRGKDAHKRKEPDTRRIDCRKEARNKRPDQDSKCPNDRRSRTPPRRPEFILPPLNAPVAQVLSEIKHEEFVKWPEKIKTDPQKRNRSKYCEFYRDHGHNTDDCFQLKEQIADLIKRGYLRMYVATRLLPNSPERKYGDNRPTAGDIQTIHSGFGSGGCLTSSRKRHARSAHRPAEEEIYNLSSSSVGDHPPITFSNDDLRGLHLSHDDALVVSTVIANFNVQRILIDNGSSVDILFILAFERMKIRLDKLHPFYTALIRFGGNMTHPLGWINLPITLGAEPHQTTVWQDFIVVDCPSPYNAILGRPTLGRVKAITLTYHLKLKFPTSTGIGEIKSDQKMARQCFISAMKVETSSGDVPGIDSKVAMLKLFTNPEHSPVRQKRRKFSPECLKVIEDEVNKLIKANVVREAHYPDWLTNVVVAPKKEGKWKVCVDFTDLNKACPKDNFPLPKIDLIVDVTFKHELLKQGLYCYKVMPFGLKNVGATYQRLVNKMFKKQIGKIREVYIDDMLVKSLQEADHITHLEEAFGILRQHQMMLNPPKCIFGVSSGKFSGFLVTKRGIEENPDQIQALVAMSSPRNIQELKKYLGSPPLLTIPPTGEDLPRLAIKAQALADFIVESTHEGTPEIEITPHEMETPKEQSSENDLARWILFVDGSSNQHGYGAGLVIQTPSGEQMKYAIRIGFKATNNKAKYEALLASLRVAVELGAQSLDVFSDSQLVVNQVQGDYLAKDTRMMAYLGEVKAASVKIKDFKIRQISREENKKADALANLASTFEFISDRCIPLKFLASPSIEVANLVLQIGEKPTWMDEIIAYLQEGTLPRDKLQTRRIQYKSARFCIFKGELYKRSFSGPLLKYLRPEKGIGHWTHLKLEPFQLDPP